MTTVTVVVHFDVNGLDIAANVVGERRAFLFHGYRCAIVLPRDDFDFGVDESSYRPRVIEARKWRDGEATKYRVYIVRVEIEVACDLTSDDLPWGGPHDPALVAAAECVFKEGAEIAGSLIRRYVDHVRIRSHQYWLGSSATVPQTTWRNEIFDAAGRRLAVGFDYIGPVVVMMGKEPLSRAANGEICGLLAADHSATLADSLLADAHFLAGQSRSPDRRQAVLLAAIACEVRIKRTLDALATPKQVALIALILDHPRDVSMAAISLFDKALLAVGGRSLRVDDKHLFKALTTLFEDRNRIAHRGGEGILLEGLNAHVQTADRVFLYLDEVAEET